MNESLHQKIVRVIKKIPKGKVATYGQIAAMAGSPRAARQVVWALHTSWDKEKLPWYRLINKKGKIGLKKNKGYELQKALLEKEGVKFDHNDIIDLEKYQWKPK